MIEFLISDPMNDLRFVFRQLLQPTCLESNTVYRNRIIRFRDGWILAAKYPN